MPLVSVIMPAYNVEPYIAAAIESALEQTFDDYEILIVDDGSTDRTASIAPRTVRAASASVSSPRPIAGCRRPVTPRCGRRAARSSRCSMATTSGIQVFSSSRWRSFASGRKYRS